MAHTRHISAVLSAAIGGLCAVAGHAQTAPDTAATQGLDGPFSTLRFDFTLNRERANLPDPVVVRDHAKAA